MAPRPRLYTPAFLGVLAMLTVFGLAFSSFVLLPKYLAVELAASGTQIGGVAAAFGFAATLLMPAAGVWIDRHSRLRFVIAGSLLMSASSFAFLAIDSMGPAVYALRFAQGAAFGMVFTAAGALVTDMAPAQRMSQAIGLLGLTVLSMNAVAPALVEAIVARWGWGPAFWMAGIAAALSCLACCFLREAREIPSRDQHVPSLRQVLLTRRALWYTSVNGLIGAAFGAIFTFSQPFALELGMTEVGGFFVGYALTAIPVRLFAGQLPDRIGRGRVALASGVLYAACVFWMAWLTPPALAWIGAAFGLAHGFFFPAFNALALEGSTDLTRGKVIALFQAAFNCGWALGGLVLGPIADGPGYPAVFQVSGLWVVLALGLLLASREMRQGLRRGNASTHDPVDPQRVVGQPAHVDEPEPAGARVASGIRVE